MSYAAVHEWRGDPRTGLWSYRTLNRSTCTPMAIAGPLIRFLVPSWWRRGGGIPGVLLASPRDDAGNLIMLGSGQQHWSTVHVADLANFLLRALEADRAHGYYVIGDGQNSTVAELTQAAAVAAGAPGAVTGSDEESPGTPRRLLR